MNIQKRLLAYVLKYKNRLILAGLCSLILAGCNLFSAYLIKVFLAASTFQTTKDAGIQYAIDYGLIDPSNLSFTLTRLVAILMLLISIPRGVFGYFGAYLVASVTNRVGNNVRGDMYAHIQSLPLKFFHKSRIGDLMSRMSSDVSIIQQSSQVVMQAIDGPITIVSGLIRMFMVSWQLSLLTIVVVPIIGIAIDKISSKIRSLTIATQESLADVSSTIEECVRGVRIIKSFGMEERETQRFDEVNNRSLKAALKAAKRNSIVLPSIEVMGGISTALILYIGGYMIMAKQIDLPKLGEFVFLAFMVAGAAKQFGRLNVLYQQVVAAGQRVFELMDVKNDLHEIPDAIVIDKAEGKIEFKNVEFAYNYDEPVLNNISFTVEPGEVVAIVGPSGAGKSTIADLVLRFYDVTSGKILVDGHDVRELSIQSLRSHIAMVPQETILFSGTIADNIAYGKPNASMDEIIEVAKAANAHTFIDQTPDKYQTKLGEGGVGLSGGQRQRISIARALLKDPKILILDEATSSLDVESEGIVQEALDRLMKGRSTLVIAHRLSTVRDAHKILVIDRGQITESGTFEDLMKTEGLFSQLYRTQFKSVK